MSELSTLKELCVSPNVARLLHEGVCYSVGAHPSWRCGFSPFPVREQWGSRGWREAPPGPQAIGSCPDLRRTGAGPGAQCPGAQGRRRHVSAPPLRDDSCRRLGVVGWCLGYAQCTPLRDFTRESFRQWEARWEAEIGPPPRKRQKVVPFSKLGRWGDVSSLIGFCCSL